MPRKTEVWICPHQYSCGGYYIAEKWQKATIKGVEYDDNMNFWLLSSRSVLSKYQAEHAMDYRRSLGEEIVEVWAEALPEGSRWINLR